MGIPRKNGCGSKSTCAGIRFAGDRCAGFDVRLRVGVSDGFVQFAGDVRRWYRQTRLLLFEAFDMTISGIDPCGQCLQLQRSCDSKPKVAHEATLAANGFRFRSRVE